MKTLRYLSLGAGVQSSTLALMIEAGEAEPVEFAVFADTGAEPSGVYEWLDWLEGQLSYPVYRVMQRNGLTWSIENDERWDGPPVYTVSNAGERGIGRRNCTREFKIVPIERFVRQRFKEGEYRQAVALHGISLDEVQRMKDSGKKWLKFEYPLVDLRMTRSHCLRWMEKNGFPTPPRSACVYCPYHNDHEWRNIKMFDPDGWKEAVRVDELIRQRRPRGMLGTPFVHKSCVPLEEADLTTLEDHGQLNFFINDCEGMCGV